MSAPPDFVATFRETGVSPDPGLDPIVRRLALSANRTFRALTRLVFGMRLLASCLAIAAALPLCSAQVLSPTVQSQTGISSAEVHRLFLEDQAARERPLSREEAIALGPQDAARRLLARKMIENDALHTGQDFEDAAFIFQHGSDADDYLLAHTLATVAVSKGKASALWIVTATLDRYLGKIGQPQIYGTQTHRTPSTPWTQEPYNRTLIPDGMLQVLGVDSRAKQQIRLDALIGGH